MVRKTDEKSNINKTPNHSSKSKKEISRLSGMSWVEKRMKNFKMMQISRVDKQVIKKESDKSKCVAEQKKKCKNINPSIILYQRLIQRHDSDYQLLVNNKKCQICRTIKSNQMETVILCDRCDDAYHCDCLKEKIRKSKVQEMDQWFCQRCLKQMKEMQQMRVEKEKEMKKQIKQQIQKQVNKEESTKCQKIMNLKQASQDEETKKETYFIIQIVDKVTLLLDYISLLQHKIFDKDSNLRLIGLQKQFWTKRQNQCFYLIPYKPQKNPFLYWSSLISALSVTKHTYCSEQVYKNKQLMKLNQSKIHKPRVCEMLHKKDEQSYEKFRQLTEQGKAPSLVVQKCQYKGFLIRATQRIACKSIICEYGGEVMSFRDSLSIIGNDSIFRLLDTGDSQTTIDIVPVQYANIAKYFLGINNQDIKNYTRINVQSLMFSYKGRNRIIFYTIKQIQKGELLYIDYNAGTLDIYPTDDFK